MRRKSSPFILLLFEALFLLILPHAHSSSISNIPSIRQRETSAPDFNVLATDDGVPVLEPGENPAKDPLVIEDMPVSTNNPDQNLMPDFSASQTNPPKTDSPSKSKFSNPSEEPVIDAEEDINFSEEANKETPDDDDLSDMEPSPENEEGLPPPRPKNKPPVSGEEDEQVLLDPEPSTLPDSPPSPSPTVTSTSFPRHTQSDVKISKGPASSNGSSPGKASGSADLKPAENDKPSQKKPINSDSRGGNDDDDDEDDHDLEPSPMTADTPKAVSPSTPQSDVAIPETSTSSDAPELSGTEMKPTPETPPTKTASNSRGGDDRVDLSNDGFIRPNAAYRCVNFGTRRFGEYQLFDESATDGSYTLYKGSGVALNPTLPTPYRYHTYGKNWTYHLNVTSDTNQNVILGFAEVFPKACASGRNGSFRVFTVLVGQDFQIIDVMKSSGCGVLQQAVFRNIKPKEQVIDLNFDAISGKAMLSVVCYGASGSGASGSEVPGKKGASKLSPNADTPEPGKNSGSSASTTTDVNKQCFEFGESGTLGFTSIGIPGLASGVEVYKDENASVDNTSSPGVYKSHVFGQEFILSLEVGVFHSVTVQLGFAEIFEPGCVPGFRVFTVKAGAELRTIDVFEEAGCSSALTVELRNVLPKANVIDIVFSSVTNFAMVSSVCIIDSNEEKGSPGFGKSLGSLTITSGPKDPEEEPEVEVEEVDGGFDSENDQPFPSVESIPEQSLQPETDDDNEGIELESPQSSTYPKDNGILVVDPPTAGSDGDDKPIGTPYPKVNGLIDATVTNSPSPLNTPGSDTGADSNDSTEGGHNAPPEPSDQLLPSDFSQTTIGEGEPGNDLLPSPDLLVSPSDPSSGSHPGLHGASGIENGSLTPSVIASPPDVPGAESETDDGPALILPTRTPVPIGSSSASDDGGTGGVVNKQGDVTIEVSSPSPSLFAVVIEGPTPSTSQVGVTIEGPSSSSSDEDVTIIGPGSGATSTPTPSTISAAAFSPVPSANKAAPSPSISSIGIPSSDTTPQPGVTAAVPSTASIGPTAAVSPSPPVVPSSTGDAVLLPPGSNPTGVATPQTSTAPDVTNGNTILPPVATSPGPQGDPDGSSGSESGLPSPPPSASISQNQIVIPAASAVPSPAETPTSASASTSPPSTNSPNPSGAGIGIGAPGGDIADSATANPTRSPVPDVVTNPSGTTDSSPRATPSPPQTTSSVGSSEVIVDSTTTEPSPSPIVSTSIGAPDDGPVQVTDNTTEIIQVTGDVGSDGSEAENQPSILVGEYKDLIATTPAGSGFAIVMGIFGSLLVLLLLVCLFFAIFRGGGAAYSYSSGYSSHKPTTDYDPSQGRYTDDLVHDPTGYGNAPSRGQNTQDGYGTDPVTFESRQEGQSESFGFEMPAAGGLGAPTEERRGNEEPDTLAEYSSHLQQATTYDDPAPQLAGSGGIGGAGTGQSQSGPYQFTGVQDSYTEKTKPDEYTFTGTFTLPRTEFRPSHEDRGHNGGPMDSVSQGSEQYLRSKPMSTDSFNDDRSIARPTNASESSGKQERNLLSDSGILQKSAITNTKARANNASSSRDGILVDDVRSSLLDSEYESTASMNSVPFGAVTARSPYDTKFIAEDVELDSGRIIGRDHISLAKEPAVATDTSQQQLQQITSLYQERTSTLPRYQKQQSAESASEMHFTATEAAGRSTHHHPSSGSNGGPWPSWWLRKDQSHQQSGYEIRENGRLEADSSFRASQGTHEVEQDGTSAQRISHSTTQQTNFDSKVIEASSGHEGNFVPDSKWRRQYSSTSDEDGSQAESDPDPYLEELRRRREPYVQSVASRLSIGPGSLVLTRPGESVFESGINRFEVAHISPDAFPTREMGHWISRDPVPV